MSKVYAVRKGRKTGIFGTWSECQEQINGFGGAEFKSFKTIEEANEYLGIIKVIESSSDELNLPEDIKDEVKWLLKEIINQSWCGQAELVENYANNLADALEISL